MLEQDKENVDVLAVALLLHKDSLKKPSAETGKDLLKYSPSKPRFFRENFQKHEPLLKKDVSCSKSNSKILKKKRQKDKFKLFKLDKHLWDSTSQIPQLGKSAKYLKKKDKLAANAQISGSHILGKEKTSIVGKTTDICSYHRSKPLEYTFDILCTTQNISLPPLVKEPEDTSEPFGNDLLTVSSSFQEIIPASKSGVTNEILLGDLIDLGTPNIFKSNVDHSNSQLSELPMNNVCELEKLSISHPLPSDLNPLVINSEEPCRLDAQASMQAHITTEVKNLEPGISENQSAPIMHCRNDSNCIRNSCFELEDQSQSSHSEPPQVLHNSNRLDERATSPPVFYGFPCLQSPMSGKQKIILTNHSRQILVDHLNKDPFPKIVRENAKVQVRRRAFSMDDSLIPVPPCRPGENDVDPQCQFVDEAETILNAEASCPQNFELSGSSQNSSEPIIEDKQHSSLIGDESNSANNHSDHEKRCSNSIEIVSSDLSEYSKATISEWKTDIATAEHKGSMCFSHSSPAAKNQSIPEKESDSGVLSEPPKVNISNEDSSIGNMPENSIESPSMAEECKSVPDVIEGSSEASDNTPHTEHQSSPLPSDSNHIEKLCDGQDKTQPSKSSTESAIEESGNGGISFLQLQVSPDLGITLGSCSKHSVQDTTDGILDAPEMGLLANGKMDESEHRKFHSQNLSDQTPILPTSDEKELSRFPISDAHVSKTNLSKFCADDNIDDVSGHLPSNVDSTLITSPTQSPETSIILGTGLSMPEQFNTDDEDPHSGKDLEQCSYHTVDYAGVDHNTEMKDCEQNIAGASIKPSEEIVSPNVVPFDDSDNDSVFGDQSCVTPLEHWVLPPGKKYRRSLSIIRNLEEQPSAYARRGRHYEKSVEEIIRLQGNNIEALTPVQNLRQRLSMRRSSWMRQITPPPVRRNTFIWSPTVPNRRTLFESPVPRKSIYSTPMQHNFVHRMSVRASPMHGPRRSRRSPLSQECASPVQYTIRDLILTICKQTEPCSFSDILNEESYAGGCKLGEGVFGEVFSISRDGQYTVLKIIPIEGQQLVNGEKQKTYQEVLSELVIAKVLDELRYEGSHESNQTSGYAQLIATSLVQGSYPKTLIRFWEEFDMIKGSDNENPKHFDDEQLFIVMEQGNGGTDLESYTFSSAKQSLSLLKQIAFSLAVAEISVEFEHRDLHWGNVLVSKTSEKQIYYTLNGTQYSVASNGVKCTIIDYTLSRIKYINQFPIYNDIGKDPEMFIATGDYQFDIYRFMKKDVEDDWSRFAPKTNARWLHYLLEKILTKVKYQRRTAKVHKDSFKALEEIGTWVEDCGSAFSVALRLAESKP